MDALASSVEKPQSETHALLTCVIRCGFCAVVITRASRLGAVAIASVFGTTSYLRRAVHGKRVAEESPRR